MAIFVVFFLVLDPSALLIRVQPWLSPFFRVQTWPSPLFILHFFPKEKIPMKARAHSAVSQRTFFFLFQLSCFPSFLTFLPPSLNPLSDLVQPSFQLSLNLISTSSCFKRLDYHPLFAMNYEKTSMAFIQQ